MANNIYGAGPTTIFDSTAIGNGNWYRVGPNMTRLSFQAVFTGSTVGSTNAGGIINIQASNDGANALATPVGTMAFTSSAASTGVSPNSDGFATDMGWCYVRANLSSASTGLSSCKVIVGGIEEIA